MLCSRHLQRDHTRGHGGQLPTREAAQEHAPLGRRLECGQGRRVVACIAPRSRRRRRPRVRLRPLTCLRRDTHAPRPLARARDAPRHAQEEVRLRVCVARAGRTLRLALLQCGGDQALKVLGLGDQAAPHGRGRLLLLARRLAVLRLEARLPRLTLGPQRRRSALEARHLTISTGWWDPEGARHCSRRSGSDRGFSTCACSGAGTLWLRNAVAAGVGWNRVSCRRAATPRPARSLGVHVLLSAEVQGCDRGRPSAALPQLRRAAAGAARGLRLQQRAAVASVPPPS